MVTAQALGSLVSKRSRGLVLVNGYNAAEKKVVGYPTPSFPTTFYPFTDPWPPLTALIQGRALWLVLHPGPYMELYSARFKRGWPKTVLILKKCLITLFYEQGQGVK